MRIDGKIRLDTIVIMIITFWIFSFLLRTEPRLKYIRLVEDIGAAKVGDTLSIITNKDTTDIGFAQDYPNGQKAILLPN